MAVGGLRRAGPASFVPCDVSMLYFETDQGDGFREPEFSKECLAGGTDHHRGCSLATTAPTDDLHSREQLGRDQDHAAGHRESSWPPPDSRASPPCRTWA